MLNIEVHDWIIYNLIRFIRSILLFLKISFWNADIADLDFKKGFFERGQNQSESEYKAFAHNI